jgi:hypothetical protein
VSTWVIPYVDLEPAFWDEVADRFGDHVLEVYAPMPGETLASGRGRQPHRWLERFLRDAPLNKAVLANPIVLSRPVEEVGPQILDALRRLHGDWGVRSVIVANLALARLIVETLPQFSVTASTLMGIATPAQALMVRDTLDALTPDTRLTRDLAGLRRLRDAFAGEIRLIVNESCLPGCPHRIQHFYEMGYSASFPRSLCQQTLDARPWLRLTGSWILPQHLHYYDGLVDRWKLAGRVTLNDRTRYLTVLDAYVNRTPLGPRDIGGGPASVLDDVEIADDWFESVLTCDKRCHDCSICRDYYRQACAGKGFGR